MVFGTFLGDLVAVVATILAVVLMYYKWSYQYWSKKGVPFLHPTFPYGNIKVENAGEAEFSVIHRCYEQLRAMGVKHGGMYALTKPLYVPVDAEYIKNILVTDFQNFYNRSNYTNEKDDPVNVHLLNMDGQRWRNMRVKLTPAFTSGKMKTMFETMLKCGEQLIDAVGKMTAEGRAVDIKEVIACYTTDIIGSCAFGIDCNSFREPDPEFRRIGRRVFYISRTRRLLRLITNSFPKLGRLLGVTTMPKDVSDFFMRLARSSLDYRRSNNFRRNDALQILTDLHKEFEEDEKVRGLDRKEVENARRPLTLEEIAANCFLFFVAGFETSSTTLSFLFYELSQNQQVQDRIRDEVNAVLAKHGGSITYESLSEMKYTRQAFDETLRKYPVVPVFKRKCTDDYKIPGTDVVLDKGTTVYVSVIGVQRNPDYFPEPDRFDPDRFSEENKGSVKAGSYLGFGEGPRICIGKRFGVMQMTIAMMMLLKNYKIRLNPKTKTPIEIDSHSLLQTPKGAIWIDLEKV